MAWTLTNTSRYSTAALRILVRFVAEEMEVAKMVRLVEVTNCRWSFRGRCFGARVLMRLGPPTAFPVTPYRRFERGPEVGIADWQEAVVALAAHEFQHTRQLTARNAARRTGDKLPRVSEVDADWAESRVLTVFRQRRADLDAEIAQAVAAEGAKEEARRDRSVARRAPEAVRQARLDDLEAKIARWTRKAKTAETYLKKYGRALRRLGGQS
jgi:hypothetical protein